MQPCASSRPHRGAYSSGSVGSGGFEDGPPPSFVEKVSGGASGGSLSSTGVWYIQFVELAIATAPARHARGPQGSVSGGGGSSGGVWGAAPAGVRGGAPAGPGAEPRRGAAPREEFLSVLTVFFRFF